MRFCKGWRVKKTCWHGYLPIMACGLWVYVMTDQNPIISVISEVRLQQKSAAKMMVFNAPDKILVKVRGSRVNSVPIII